MHEHINGFIFSYVITGLTCDIISIYNLLLANNFDLNSIRTFHSKFQQFSNGPSGKDTLFLFHFQAHHPTMCPHLCFQCVPPSVYGLQEKVHAPQRHDDLPNEVILLHDVIVPHLYYQASLPQCLLCYCVSKQLMEGGIQGVLYGLCSVHLHTASLFMKEQL